MSNESGGYIPPEALVDNSEQAEEGKEDFIAQAEAFRDAVRAAGTVQEIATLGNRYTLCNKMY